MARIKSFSYVGKKQTYDLEVEHKDHQYFLENGCLTSNSHAVAYAIDSYQSAWLMTYYTAEWLCSYLETMVESPNKKAKALSELKSLGYKIKKIDINYANESWTILPKKHFMPSFLTIKGVGLAAVEEIQKNRPYRDVYNLLWDDNGKWRHSKFNKRALDSLIKIGALDSLDMVGEGKTFSSYRHMQHVIVENMAEIKHTKNGRKNFERILEESRGIEDWTKLEKIEFLEELIGDIDIGMFVSEKILQIFQEKKLFSINHFTDDSEEHKHNIGWFVLTDLTWRKTKNKKDYALLTAMGDNGQTFRVYCWGAHPEKTSLKLYSVYLAELEKSDFGFTTRAWKLKEVG